MFGKKKDPAAEARRKSREKRGRQLELDHARQGITTERIPGGGTRISSRRDEGRLHGMFGIGGWIGFGEGHRAASRDAEEDRVAAENARQRTLNEVAARNGNGNGNGNHHER